MAKDFKFPNMKKSSVVKGSVFILILSLAFIIGGCGDVTTFIYNFSLFVEWPTHAFEDEL